MVTAIGFAILIGVILDALGISPWALNDLEYRELLDGLWNEE